MTELTPKFYPAFISRAVACLDEVDSLKSLPDGFLRVLIRIVKKIDLSKPHQAIYASRSTLAEESGKSVETVHRAVKWLEENAFIARQQYANPGNRGSRSPITPTAKLLAAIGLEQPTQNSTSKVREQIAFQTTTAIDGRMERTSHPKQSFSLVDGMKVPTELLWLVRHQGLTASGILKLMACATAAGKRLSTLVQATKSYLGRFQGKQLYAYIKALISKDRDFGKTVQDAEEKENFNKCKQTIEMASESLNGRSFEKSDGSTRYKIEEGFIVVYANQKRSVAPLSMKFIEALTSGRIREI